MKAIEHSPYHIIWSQAHRNLAWLGRAVQQGVSRPFLNSWNKEIIKFLSSTYDFTVPAVCTLLTLYQWWSSATWYAAPSHGDWSNRNCDDTRDSFIRWSPSSSSNVNFHICSLAPRTLPAILQSRFCGTTYIPDDFPSWTRRGEGLILRRLLWCKAWPSKEAWATRAGVMHPFSPGNRLTSTPRVIIYWAKLKILKHLKTREKIQNGFTETLRRQRRVCCRDMYDPYGENTETWLELLEAIPLAGSCLVQISQQQAVLPRFIVHRPITVWMHSSWARFHWDEHILLYSSCTWFHWRGMWISFRLCFKPAMIVMYFDGSLDPIDLGLEKEVSHASCRNPEEGIMLSSSFAVASGMVWEFWSMIVWMLCVWFTKWIHSSGVQGILWCPCFCSLTLLCVWLAPCRADSSFLMSWGPCPSLNVKKSGTFSPCLRIVVVHRHRKAEHGVM